MPQIGPDLWKVALSFFWWREYADGRVEQEFDSLTGQIRPWGKTPDGLKRVGWMPVSADLAAKMRAYGEFGTPTNSPEVIVEVHPGEEPVIYKDCAVLMGFQVRCKACSHEFRSLARPHVCPACGAKPVYRCGKCDKLTNTKICPDCRIEGRYISPFRKGPAKWEEVQYVLGIKGKFLNRFNTHRLTTEH